MLLVCQLLWRMTVVNASFQTFAVVMQLVLPVLILLCLAAVAKARADDDEDAGRGLGRPNALAPERV